MHYSMVQKTPLSTLYWTVMITCKYYGMYVLCLYTVDQNSLHVNTSCSIIEVFLCLNTSKAIIEEYLKYKCLYSLIYTNIE
jgi:hypothetical protein